MAPSRRTILLAGATTAIFSVAATPTVVVADSITGELIRGLNRRLLYMAVPIAVLVEFILLYTVWRFHDSDVPKPTRENQQLEITWTLVTGLVLLFVGVASYSVFTHPYVSVAGHDAGQSHGSGGSHGGLQPGDAPPEAVEVEIVTYQWNYSFVYHDANVTVQDELVLPTNRPVYLYVTSEDVLHSFHVPGLGLKQDAFPGQYNVIRTQLLENGSYRLYCAEYCGTEHAFMRTTVRVVNPGEFREWLDDERTESTAGVGHPNVRGQSTIRGHPNVRGQP